MAPQDEMSAPGDSSHNKGHEGVVRSPFNVVSWFLRIFQARIRHTPSSTNECHETTATELHRFLELPPEIRRLIWRLSLPPARVYEPVQGVCAFADFLASKPTRFVREWPPPDMRAVCREAYNVCMAAGRFRFGYFDGSSVRGVWYNNDADAVYFATEDMWRHPLGDIKNIYVGTEIVLDPTHLSAFIADCDMASCSRFIVAVDPKAVGSGPPDFEGTEPFFRPMKDEDVVGFQKNLTGSLPDDVSERIITWADLRLFLNDYLNYQPVIPRLEAVEVFRRPVAREGEAPK